MSDKNKYEKRGDYRSDSSGRDVFSSDKASRASSGKQGSGFKVSIPESEKSVFTPARTPQGRRMSGVPSDRTPQGRRMSDAGQPRDVSSSVPERTVHHPEGRASQSARPRQNAVSSDDRIPRGNRVSPPPVTHSRPSSSAGHSPARPEDISSNSAKRKKKPQYKSKVKKHTGRKAAVTILCLLLIAIIGLGAYGYSVLKKINYDPTVMGKNKYIDASSLASDKDVKNILFIGSDSRGEIQGMRSDTMMLCSIDKKHKKIKLASFLRDSYVYIPETQTYRKLNAACSIGGAQLVIDTIEYNFKIKIDEYILVDFEAFAKMVDLMGGLDVPGVTEKEAEYLRDEVKIIYAKKGTNHFSGAATLWYCRIRYLDNDFYRTERQRKVISCLVKEMSKTNPVKLVSIANEVLPMISTTISPTELIKLGGGAVASYMRYDIVQQQVPAEGTWSYDTVSLDGAIVRMDIDKNADILYDFIYKDKVPKKAS